MACRYEIAVGLLTKRRPVRQGKKEWASRRAAGVGKGEGRPMQDGPVPERQLHGLALFVCRSYLPYPPRAGLGVAVKPTFAAQYSKYSC